MKNKFEGKFFWFGDNADLGNEVYDLLKKLGVKSISRRYSGYYRISTMNRSISYGDSIELAENYGTRCSIQELRNYFKPKKGTLVEKRTLL